MIQGFLKAVISGLSVAVMLMFACLTLDQLALLCDEHFIVMEKRSLWAQWIAQILPDHAWQTCVMFPVIWLGFAKLDYQANHSLSTVLYRVFIALTFVAICVMVFPLIRSSRLVSAAPVTWKSFVLPVLCTIPLLVSVTCCRQKKP